jgi:hypothetical protein
MQAKTMKLNTIEGETRQVKVKFPNLVTIRVDHGNSQNHYPNSYRPSFHNFFTQSEYLPKRLHKTNKKGIV